MKIDEYIQKLSDAGKSPYVISKKLGLKLSHVKNVIVTSPTSGINKCRLKPYEQARIIELQLWDLIKIEQIAIKRNFGSINEITKRCNRLSNKYASHV